MLGFKLDEVQKKIKIDIGKTLVWKPVLCWDKISFTVESHLVTALKAKITHQLTLSKQQSLSLSFFILASIKCTYIFLFEIQAHY